MRRQEVFSTGPYPATTTRLRFESTGGNAFSISSSSVTPFPACILRTSATALRALYGIARRICRTLINQTGADRWHIFICMGFFMCVHFWATKDRYLCRCRSASFFRRMATTWLALYLHPIIHISCLVFFGRMKYNKKCYRRYEYSQCLATPNKYRKASRLAQEEMWWWMW